MHLSDEELYVLQDGALPQAAAEEAWLHLRECPACDQRRRELERRRQEIAGLLVSLDSTTPQLTPEALMAQVDRRGRRSRGLLAAAVATLLVGGIAVAFAGSLPLHWLGRLLGVASPQREPAPSPPSSERRSGVALVPGAALDISWRERQAVGAIRITLVSSPQVTVWAIGDSVVYTVGADAVVVANDGGTTASYDILLPRLLARATIRVGGQLIFAKRDSEIVTPVPIDSATAQYIIPFSVLKEKGKPLL